MGVFHIEHEKLIFTPFNCTHVLSIILPIWDVLVKLFEVEIKLTMQTQVIKLYKICSLVHDLWKNIIMTLKLVW